MNAMRWQWKWKFKYECTEMMKALDIQRSETKKERRKPKTGTFSSVVNFCIRFKKPCYISFTFCSFGFTCSLSLRIAI